MLGNHTNFIPESKSYEITHVFGRLYKTRSSAVRCSGSCTVYPHKVHTQFDIRLYASSNIHLKCTDESISMFFASKLWNLPSWNEFVPGLHMLQQIWGSASGQPYCRSLHCMESKQGRKDRLQRIVKAKYDSAFIWEQRSKEEKEENRQRGWRKTLQV